MASTSLDFDAIRPPTPRLTRLWVATFALIAIGSFGAGLAQKALGPVVAQAELQDEGPVATVPLAQPLAPDVQPAMQVAAAPVTPRPAPPKLDLPEPAEPAVATAQVPAATAPALPAETTAAPTVAPAQAEDPPT